MPTRLRILERLREDPSRPWSLDDAAAEFGVDRTVAFEHLEGLLAAGLVAKQTLRSGRGRPRNSYRYMSARREASQPAQRSGLLAELLARSLSIIPGGADNAYEVGRQFGGQIESLDGLGGDYRVEEGSVHALTCMFGATCASAREVVCGLHAGLIEGTMAAGPVIGMVRPKGPDGLGGCVFEITARKADSSEKKGGD